VPAVTVVRGPGEERPAPVVERALSGPAGPRGRSWRERVTLVPGGGQGPSKGRPGEQQEDRDKARACLPLPGPRRIVVLGCTSGAGQTVMALMTARLLASLRAEPVAVLDLNPGPGSLTSRAQCAPAGTVRDLLAGSLPAAPGGAPASAGTAATGPAASGLAASGTHPAGRLDVINTGAAPDSAKGLEEGDFSRIGEYLTGRYGISLVDPGASAVGRVLAIADQLLLVAPASGDAPRAVSMTQEWLAQHDHAGLAEGAVMVVNGVSGRSMADVEKAEAIMQGRCRAIVRVPWEDQLGADGGPAAGAAALRLPARQALTAVAGLLISGLAVVPGAVPGAAPGAAPAAGPGDQK
jgi:MinD-like ATPase involved in chromosome partitioning or flagellar assembly